MTAAITAEGSRESSFERVARLFEAHHQRLYRLARRLLAEPAEAQDLVQETFLRAVRRPSSVPAEETAAEAWLVRILVNLCRDLHRRRRVRERPAPSPAPLVTRGLEDVVVARATVEALLARLSPRRRAVLVLAELEERPTAEIARLLGIAQVTVRWHLAAARSAMSHHLAEDSR